MGTASPSRDGSARKPEQRWERIVAHDGMSLVAWEAENQVTRPLIRRMTLGRGQAWLGLSYSGCCLVEPRTNQPRHLATPQSAVLAVGPISIVTAYGRGMHDWVEMEWNRAQYQTLHDWMIAGNHVQAGEGGVFLTHLTHEDRGFGATLNEIRRQMHKPGQRIEPFLVGAIHEIASRAICSPAFPALAFIQDGLPSSLAELMAEVKAAPDHRWTLEAASDTAGYSHYHLSRAFRQSLGFGFPEFVDRCRTERAVTEVLKSEATIEELSKQLSYGSPQALRDAFRRLTGFLPSELRNLNVYVA